MASQQQMVWTIRKKLLGGKGNRFEDKDLGDSSSVVDHWLLGYVCGPIADRQSRPDPDSRSGYIACILY